MLVGVRGLVRGMVPVGACRLGWRVLALAGASAGIRAGVRDFIR